MVSEDRGPAHLEWQDEAHAAAILRNVGEALTAPGPASFAQRPASKQDAPAGGRPEPGQRFQEFALSVARHSRDTDDFSCPDRERDPAHPPRPPLVAHAQVLHREQVSAGTRLALLDPEKHPPSHHQLRELGHGGFGRVAVSDHRSLAHHRDPVGHRHDLPQLVGDQDDRLPLFLQPAQDPEEVIGLLRGECAGRFVQNQDFGPAVQRLQDLHPLLQAHRQVAHHRVRRHFERIVLRELRQHPTRALLPGDEQRSVLRPENQVLDHGEGVHQHEVLVDHADARRNGAFAVPDGHRPPGDPDLTPIGPVEAVQDAHQGGFAGAVLADNSVNGAALDRETHVPVRVDAPETLVDPDKLDRRRDAIGHFGPRRRPGRIRD